MTLPTVLLWVALVLLGFALFAGLSGAPWVPARRDDFDAMLGAACLKKFECFVELGCGDGRLLAYAASRCKTAVGYEVHPLLWFIAWLRNIKNPNVSVRLGNFWSADLSDADVVMAFLVPRTMARLERKVRTELHDGARLISYVFELPNTKPKQRGKSWLLYEFAKKPSQTAR